MNICNVTYRIIYYIYHQEVRVQSELIIRRALPRRFCAGTFLRSLWLGAALGAALLSSWGAAQSSELLSSMAMNCERAGASVEIMSTETTGAETTSDRLVYDCQTNSEAFRGYISLISPDVVARATTTGGPTRAAALPNPDEAVWIFDEAYDGVPELILRLYRDADGAVAELYDRRVALGSLLRRCCGAAAFSQFEPTVRVRSAQGWGAADNPAYNLDLEIDGDVYTIFGGSEKLAKWLETDGETDYKITVRDTDEDGRPELEYRQAQLSGRARERVEAGKAIERTAIMVNPEDDEPVIRPWMPWPYLGPETYGYLTNSYFSDSYPPIQVDWDRGLITTVGEFVRSRGNDNQWFSYAFEDLETNAPNVLDFEYPFAFYNLVDDPGFTPDLSIRMTYIPPYSYYLYFGGYPEPVTQVRYSWKQQIGEVWRRYKLGLSGQQQPHQQQSFGEFDLTLFAPYETLPTWVTEQSWTATTFVTEMGLQSRVPTLGEGLYDWDISTLSGGAFQRYLQGVERSRDNALSGTSDVAVGRRGEYSLSPESATTLYFSPVDGELHLRHAEGGVWNLDESRYLRYADADGDGYIDVWSLEKRSVASAEPNERAETPPADPEAAEGEPVTEVLEQLIYADGYLVLATEHGVTLRQVTLPPPPFEVKPPTDKASWQVLKSLLEEHAKPFSPNDLTRAFEQFSGPTADVPRAKLSSYGAGSQGGFSLSLDIPAIPLDSSLLPLRTGHFLYTHDVTYDATYEAAGGWRFEEVREAGLLPELGVGALTKLEPASLTVKLTNLGNLDLTGDATLQVNGAEIFAWTPLNVGADGASTSTVVWTPESLDLATFTLEFAGQSFDLGTFPVAPPDAVSLGRLTDLSFAGDPLLFALLLAAVSYFLLIGTWGLLSRR